ncbi:juvenile hormone acid O-methyltransferase-like [Ornithodoros turicata]|uniref:juvenile hormone acid O-methyltransferase-like n=1 Tax=Ornithodoros turicata TaxID=34597 RepID=UPI0031389194
MYCQRIPVHGVCRLRSSAVPWLPLGCQISTKGTTCQEGKPDAELRSVKIGNMNPALYSANNWLQIGVGRQLTEWLNPAFQEDEGDQQYLDIGCGDGAVTRNVILENSMPCRRLVGTDISSDMVEYAREHHAHPKLAYDVLDICGDMSMFKKQYGQFRRVYSFFAMHWLEDQDKGFKNVEELMTPDGECLLAYVGSQPAFDILEQLATMQRWRAYADCFRRYVPLSNSIANQRGYMERQLKNAGLKPHTCEVLRISWKTASEKALADMFEPLLPLTDNAPAEDREELIRDFMPRLLKHSRDETTGDVALRFKLFVVHASKVSKT